VNFGIVYGLSAFGLAQQLGIPQAEAAGFIRRYFERYAGVKAYIERSLQEARREGRVRTLFGRVRPIPNLDSRNPPLRGFAERTAINTPLQGTAADLIKLAMVRLQPQLAGHAARLLLQVHDELVLEAPAEAANAVAEVVRTVMEQVAELAVPLQVEVGSGPNWRDLQ
jgi:DNA polymerase-1